jgi:ubiquinone/menaquinone biosynthesis C-methylase UbiE
MPAQVRFERVLLGLRGLALLRGWPLGDAANADEQIAEIGALVRRGSDPLHVTGLGVEDAYALWSKTYDGPNPLISAEEPGVRRLLERLPAGTAIDLACGTGRWSKTLADLGHDVVGIDLTPEMLTGAAAKVPSASFMRGDLQHVPVADGSADLVVCSLALTHVPRLRPAIEEIGRIVKPGGAVILSDIHPVAVATGGHAFFPTGERSRAVSRNELHWIGEYIDAFEHAGLDILSCEEPVYEAEFVEEAKDPALRAALLAAVPGLPFALVWSLRRAAK